MNLGSGAFGADLVHGGSALPRCGRALASRTGASSFAAFHALPVKTYRLSWMVKIVKNRVNSNLGRINEFSGRKVRLRRFDTTRAPGRTGISRRDRRNARAAGKGTVRRHGRGRGTPRGRSRLIPFHRRGKD